MLNILSDFLRTRKQTVTLNGQSSSWTNVNAGVPQGCILGPQYKHDINTSAIELKSDLKKTPNDSAFQWKMTFNSDHSKKGREIISIRKLKRVTHPPLLFNNNNVSQVNSQKHLGIILS